MSEDQEQKKTERLHLLISPAELDAIDDWRFANRLGTRAEAVRRLVQIGLLTQEALPKLVALSAIALDRLAKAVDKPAEIQQREPDMAPEKYHETIALELFDEVNFSFNESFEAYSELMRLIAAIGPLGRDVPYEEARELSKAIAEEIDGAGAREVHKLLKPRYAVWHEHMRKFRQDPPSEEEL